MVWRLQRIASVLMALASTAAFDFTEEAFECEHAAAHLEACCAGLELYSDLCQHDTGCDADAIPELSIDESTCVQRLACEDLVAQGICNQAAEDLTDPTTFYYDPAHGYPTRSALCP